MVTSDTELISECHKIDNITFIYSLFYLKSLKIIYLKFIKTNVFNIEYFYIKNAAERT